MKRQKYNVTGMTCAACQANVEGRVKKIEGVMDVEVSLLSNRMSVDYDEGVTDDREIIAAVTEIGYGASVMGTAPQKAENSAENEGRSMLKRLISSVVLMIPLMYIAMGHMMALPMPSFLVGSQNALIGPITQMLIAIVVIFINRKFFIVGTKALLHRAPNMDSLVAIGSGASFVYGVIVIYRMAFAMGQSNFELAAELSHELYFESAAMILTLVTVGKYLEARSKAKTTTALDKLMELAPKTATVLRDGKEHTVACSDISVGDKVVVKPGEAIAVDGRIVSGHGWVDQSAVTGESVPIEKSVGDEVISATINKNGSFVFEAKRVGEETTISQIIKLVDEAGSSKPPIARLADRVSGIFVPLVILIALVTFGVWMLLGYDFDFALSLGISVLVISCPCALGLATPVAIMVGTGKAAREGILIKSAAALEGLYRVDTVVLDKTGTITMGCPKVTDITLIKGEEAQLLSLALSLEKSSEHPLARAVCEYATKRGALPVEVSDFKALPGRGVTAVYKEKEVLSGNLKLMQESGIALDPAIITAYTEEGKTPLIFAFDKKAIGIIAVADSIRNDSAEAIAAMKKRGLDVIMLTGDNRATAAAIGQKAGIEHIISDVMPSDKEACVKKLQKQGKKVAMVGDGINDAPALTRADVGIAIGCGSDIAIDSADIVLMKNSLLSVLCSIELSSDVIRNIKMNLFWAFFYNILGIPLAAGALFIPFGIRLNPMIGAAAMSLSSVCVVSNALRLYRFKNKYKTEATEKGDVKNMEKTLKVEGMMCMHCKAHVEKALLAVEGVSAVAVDLDKKTATVTLTADVSTELLVRAVTDAGYTVVQ